MRILCAIVLLAAACTSTPPADFLESVRVQPALVTLDRTAFGATTDALLDRDTGTAISITAPTRMTVRLAARTKISAVFVFGATNVRVSDGSSALDIEEEGVDRWSRLTVRNGEPRDAIQLDFTPLGDGARMAEIEIWGLGRTPAPRDPVALTTSGDPAAFENMLRVPVVPERTLLTVGNADRCALLSFDLGIERRAVRRAYFSYRGPSLKRAIVLSRSLNGHAASGGFWMGTTRDKKDIIDELDPNHLEASNSVTLCLPNDATMDIPIEGLSITAELEDGTNLLDRDGQANASAAWDLDNTTTQSGDSWELALASSTQLHRARFEAALSKVPPSSTEVRAAAEWLPVTAALNDPTVRAHAVRVAFPPSARPDLPAAQLAEIALSGSPVGAWGGSPRLVITYPLNGEHFGSSAYVAGFVQGSVTIDRLVELYVDGAPHSGGATIAKKLERPEADSSKPWVVEIEAHLADGSVLKKTLFLDNDQRKALEPETSGSTQPATQSTSQQFGALDEVASATIDVGGGHLELGQRVKLIAPPGAVAAPKTISVSRKSSHVMPRLDPALLNVTAPEGNAFRFLPEGTKFLKPVRVHLPYDPKLVPDWMSPQDVRTYFYDEALEHWVPLPRVSVNATTQTVESETDHFTFMINAVVVLPEHPGPVAFNPTSLKDLKAADPSTGIDLIEPPEGNNQGTARVALALRLPPARGAFQPDLRLTYDSNGGNGWVGVGWDVSVPRIDVETRFGVPAYDGTERYLLEGEAIVPVAESTQCIDGSNAVRFARRTERDFMRIRRCGGDPTSYYWEVTDKMGTIFTYGRSDGRLADPLAGAANIARWGLESVLDANGNLTEYSYEQDNEGTAEGCVAPATTCEPFRQVYLTAIKYTRNTVSNLPAKYRVDFVRQRSISSSRYAQRVDVISSGRTGFKVVTRQRLAAIKVSFADTVFRDYRLTYVTGDFGKSLLASIGLAGTSLFDHVFTYTKAAAAATAAFSAPVKWEPISDPFAISRSDEDAINRNIFLGFGEERPAVVGFRSGYDSREQATRTLLADLNGDGLPDRIFFDPNAPLGASRFRVEYNRATPVTNGFEEPNRALGFDAAPPPGDIFTGSVGPLIEDTLPGLGSERGHSFLTGLEAFFFSLAKVDGTAWSPSALFDANGDGLIDYVSSGGVRFQRERRPDCMTSSCRLPGVIGFGAGEALAIDAGVPDDVQAASEELLQAERHRQDVLLQWVAPFAGTVDVSGLVQRVRAGGRDGVQLTMLKNGSLQDFTLTSSSASPRAVIAFDDVAPHTLRSDGIVVTGGDRLNFQISTLDDFSLASDGSPEDELIFRPIIKYQGKNYTLRETAGGKTYEYSLADDLRLAGDPVVATAVGRGAKLEVKLTTSKPVATTDDVRVCIQKFAAGGSIMPRRCGGADTSFTIGWSQVNPVPFTHELQVAAGEQLIIRQESDLPFDPDSVLVDAAVTVKEECTAAGTCTPVPPRADGQPLTLDTPTFVAIHQPARLPVEPWVVPDLMAGQSAVFEIGGGFDSVHTEEVHFAVVLRRAADGSVKRLFKRTCGNATSGFFCGLGAIIPVFRETLAPGDQVVFEFHADLEASFAAANFRPFVNWVVTSNGMESKVPMTNVPVNRTFNRDLGQFLGGFVFPTNQPTSGGYRGWRVLQWNGSGDFDESKIRIDAFAQYVGKPADEIAAIFAGKTLEENSPEKAFLTLFSAMSPAAHGVELKSGERLWRGPDGATFVGKGFVHASKAGGARETSGTGSVVTLQLGQQVRMSKSRSYSAGLAVFIASGGASTGWSSARSDVMDTNGDGVVDLVNPGTISQTNAALGRGRDIAYPTTPFQLDPFNLTPAGASTSIRHFEDLSINVGLGHGVTISTNKSNGEKEEASTGSVAMALTGGVGTAFNRQRTTEDMFDVNGDGLPDKVSMTRGELHVFLNLGNRFAQTADVFPVHVWATGIDELENFISQHTKLDDPLDFSDAAPLLPIEEDREHRRQTIDTGLAALESPNALAMSSTLSFSGNVGLNVDVGIGAGVSQTQETSLTSTPVGFFDVTGDGLPDYVKRGLTDSEFRVQVNTGHSFGEEQAFAAPAWSIDGRDLALPCFRLNSPSLAGRTLDQYLSQVGGAGSTQLRALLQFVVGGGNLLCNQPFLPLPRGLDTLQASGVHSRDDEPSIGVWLKLKIPIYFTNILIEPGVSTSKRESGFELGMQDIDGDGFADHVLKTKNEGATYARLNQLTGGNMLQTVKRPLGGGFKLQYVRVGNTVDMPESRFVMHQVKVADSPSTSEADTGHFFTTTYAYEGGRYHRLEKEFFGFSKVKRANPDSSTVVQTFSTESLAKKGLLLTEELRGPPCRRCGFPDGAPFTRTTNGYVVRTASAPRPSCVNVLPYPLNKDTQTCASLFPALLTQTREFFEGQATPGVTTTQHLDYDEFGNVKHFRDEQDDGPGGDDLVADVVYSDSVSALRARYIIGKPVGINVTDGNATLLRQRTSKLDDTTGNLTSLTSTISTSPSRQTTSTLTWTPEGNLETLTGPPTPGGPGGYKLTYSYDNDVHTHVASITDSHGLTSQARYEPKFGDVTQTMDVAGQCTVRELDAFGRLVKVYGPLESAPGSALALCQPVTGAVAALDISYFATAQPAYSVTKHKLPPEAAMLSASPRTLDTVVFADGLRRVIQTKKTADVRGQVGFSVSGHVVFDGIGRVAEQGQVVFEPSLSSPGTFFPAPGGAPKNPTKLTHDVLGRVVATLEPDGASSNVAFDFGTPAGGASKRFRATVTDAEGKVRVVYRDTSDRVAAVEERTGGQTATTGYSYNAVGELKSILDAKDNPTTMGYDLLGRRTSLVNRDTGFTEFFFDQAGNLEKKIDPNLRALGQFISYEYEFNRLKKVDHPSSADVTFTYGAAGAPENGAGRLVSVSDEAGVETRGYGALGELVRTTRSVSVLPGQTVTHTTRFHFDSFGRMLSMVYPDGEELTNEYDSGGLLRAVRGTLAGVTQEYMKRLQYDEFGQRVDMQLGNGVTTTYTYLDLTRRLHTVATLLPQGRAIQRLTYTYDKVGNVKSLVNDIGGAPTKLVPKRVESSYGYDDLHRLVSATGHAEVESGGVDNYSSTFDYDLIHNMVLNKQVHTLVSGQGHVDQPTDSNHNWTYSYAASPGRPHAVTQLGDVMFGYDDNGNTLSEDNHRVRRRYAWTEENWLREVTDNGTTTYFYDGSGERVVKKGRMGAQVYMGQFFSSRKNEVTKHIFAGETRLVSKMSAAAPPGANGGGNGGGDGMGHLGPNPGHGSGTPNGEGTPGHEVGVVWACDQGEGKHLGVIHWCTPGGGGGGGNGGGGKTETFWYHSDHLGSTAFLTDTGGAVVEHVEYYPYGEPWRMDGPNKPVSEYLFSSKLMEPETGLTYFGARYYDARRARWTNPDPATASIVERRARQTSDSLSNRNEDFLVSMRRRSFAGMSVSLSAYTYANSNPVVYVDPDGLDPLVILGRLPISARADFNAAAGAALQKYSGYDMSKAIFKDYPKSGKIELTSEELARVTDVYYLGHGSRNTAALKPGGKLEPTAAEFSELLDNSLGEKSGDVTVEIAGCRTIQTGFAKALATKRAKWIRAANGDVSFTWKIDPKKNVLRITISGKSEEVKPTELEVSPPELPGKEPFVFPASLERE